jgi:hypothetical protein
VRESGRRDLTGSTAKFWPILRTAAVSYIVFVFVLNFKHLNLSDFGVCRFERPHCGFLRGRWIWISIADTVTG